MPFIDKGRPSNVIFSVPAMRSPSEAGLPSTLRRPSLIQVSTWRRDPWPAAARTFWMRSANRVRPLVDHQFLVRLFGRRFALLEDLADVQFCDDSAQVVVLAHAFGLQHR